MLLTDYKCFLGKVEGVLGCPYDITLLKYDDKMRRFQEFTIQAELLARQYAIGAFVSCLILATTFGGWFGNVLI